MYKNIFKEHTTINHCYYFIDEFNLKTDNIAFQTYLYGVLKIFFNYKYKYQNAHFYFLLYLEINILYDKI